MLTTDQALTQRLDKSQQMLKVDARLERAASADELIGLMVLLLGNAGSDDFIILRLNHLT